MVLIANAQADQESHQTCKEDQHVQQLELECMPCAEEKQGDMLQDVQRALEEDVSCDLECTICFEPVGERLELPCACKVTYCTGCWDRSLAQSVRLCHQPRCPTCRCPVRVDFDAESRRMVFSREQEEIPEDGWARHAQTAQDRRTAQARPAQISILQQYGAEHDALWYAGVGKIDPVKAISHLATTVSAPKCVCGCSLKYMSLNERVRDFYQRILPEHISRDSLQFESIIRNHRSNAITCDLCSDFVPTTASVWTCENRENTILHTNSYDVCDGCFARYIRSLAPAGPATSAGSETLGSVDVSVTRSKWKKQRRTMRRSSDELVSAPRTSNELAHGATDPRAVGFGLAPHVLGTHGWKQSLK